MTDKRCICPCHATSQKPGRNPSKKCQKAIAFSKPQRLPKYVEQSDESLLLDKDEKKSFSKYMGMLYI